MPMSASERTLYDLLIEIKETNAAIRTDIGALKTNISSVKNELDAVKDMTLNNRHDIVKITSGMKAWITAAAAIGGIVGWLLSVVKEVFVP